VDYDLSDALLSWYDCCTMVVALCAFCSTFGDVFDAHHFSASLAGDVQVVPTLPQGLSENVQARAPLLDASFLRQTGPQDFQVSPSPYGDLTVLYSIVTWVTEGRVLLQPPSLSPSYSAPVSPSISAPLFQPSSLNPLISPPISCLGCLPLF